MALVVYSVLSDTLALLEDAMLSTFAILCRYSFVPVTARKNQPSSYRFIQANQRNSWTIHDWTSQIPLVVALSTENNQDVINITEINTKNSNIEI